MYIFFHIISLKIVSVSKAFYHNCVTVTTLKIKVELLNGFVLEKCLRKGGCYLATRDAIETISCRDQFLIVRLSSLC